LCVRSTSKHIIFANCKNPNWLPLCKKYVKTLVVCNGAVPFKAGIPQRHVPQFKSMTRDHEQVGCIPHICLRISDLNLNTFAAILKIYELYSI